MENVNKPTQNKFSKEERELLKVRITELRFQGKTHKEIAQIISEEYKPIAQQTVSFYFKKLREQWSKKSEANFEEQRNEILSELENLKREHWKAWHRSLNPIKVKKSKKGKKGSNEDASAEVQEFDSSGDIRFLNSVESVIDKITKIKGAYSPEKTDNFNLNIDYDKLSLSGLERLSRRENPKDVLSDPTSYKSGANPGGSAPGTPEA
jgi:hypothetical protein